MRVVRAMEHPKKKVDDAKSDVSATLSEFGAAMGMFAVLAWTGALPMEVVTAGVVFFFAGSFASVLFQRLAGIRRLPRRFSKWFGFLQPVILGFLLWGAGEYGHEYIGYIGIGGAALASLIMSLMAAAWRQRRSERRLYRETLFFPG